MAGSFSHSYAYATMRAQSWRYVSGLVVTMSTSGTCSATLTFARGLNRESFSLPEGKGYGSLCGAFCSHQIVLRPRLRRDRSLGGELSVAFPICRALQVALLHVVHEASNGGSRGAGAPLGSD